jgi:hypothetical protein
VLVLVLVLVLLELVLEARLLRQTELFANSLQPRIVSKKSQFRIIKVHTDALCAQSGHTVKSCQRTFPVAQTRKDQGLLVCVL